METPPAPEDDDDTLGIPGELDVAQEAFLSPTDATDDDTVDDQEHDDDDVPDAAP